MIGVVVIHGMGDQQPGFSADLVSELSARLGDAADRFAWQEVFWANVLQSRENELWRMMQTAKTPAGDSIPVDWRAVRQFVIHNFGDALAYHRGEQSGSVYGEVHRRISDRLTDLYRTLNDPSAPVVVLAHSLGAHMMSQYIWDRQKWQAPPADDHEPIPNLAALVTFGCNIPLFSLEFAVATPIDLPGAGITKPAVLAASRWLNFVDRDDVLGWPLRPLYDVDRSKLTAAQRGTVDRIDDFEINVGSIATSWNPAAHVEYWTDDDFTRPVAEYLGALADAVDA